MVETCAYKVRPYIGPMTRYFYLNLDKYNMDCVEEVNPNQEKMCITIEHGYSMHIIKVVEYHHAYKICGLHSLLKW